MPLEIFEEEMNCLAPGWVELLFEHPQLNVAAVAIYQG